jgi:hypothetical protein
MQREKPLLWYLVSGIEQIFEWEKCWLLSKECLWHFPKHIYMPQGERCLKFCKIYSSISSALKEVEAWVQRWTNRKWERFFLFFWDEAGFALSTKLDSRHDK